MTDQETTYRYCECTRHETKHEIKTKVYPGWSGSGWVRKEDSYLKCTECHQEKNG